MSGPLDDVLVVDLSRALAGPHATMMLGDLGARVIKVEAPGHGDDTRGWGPPFVGDPRTTRQSTYFLSANRNKESITLDLKDEADRDVLLRLVDRADVLVENFRTGVLERLGLGIEALQQRNPRLVVLSITGFGHDGPEGGRAGYDQIAQGEAGLMSLTGSGPDDPQRVGVPIADLLAGMYGAYGVARRAPRAATAPASAPSSAPRCSPPSSACTPSRAPGGRWPARSAARRATTTRRSRPTGCSTAATARCRSRSAARACGGGSATASGSTRPPRGWPPTPSGSATASAVIEVVEAAFADWDAEPLLARLAEVGVPAGKVRTLDEVYAWDQTASQGLLVDVDHATLGPLTLPGPPLRFFSTTARRSPAATTPPRRRSTSTGTRSAPGWRATPESARRVGHHREPDAGRVGEEGEPAVRRVRCLLDHGRAGHGLRDGGVGVRDLDVELPARRLVAQEGSRRP